MVNCLQWYGLLCPTSMSPAYGEFWVSSINLISVCVAMSALIQFYLVIHHEIPAHDPLWKFIAVKFVVFFSFWQSIVISILDQNNVIQGTVSWSADNTADLIENFLVSFEMVVAAFIHLKAFGYMEYVPTQAGPEGAATTLAGVPKTRIGAGLYDTLNVTDIIHDIVVAPGEVREVKRMRKERHLRRGELNASFNELNTMEEGGIDDMDVSITDSTGANGQEQEGSGGATVNAKPSRQHNESDFVIADDE
ncbi:hypothetical protein HDU79_005657 [Rhizoclosmatium sp. JEL0117]|nr:hypothetical protein HDU79_005657 [Rhizoclosmatium sp. JEL0117]